MSKNERALAVETPGTDHRPLKLEFPAFGGATGFPMISLLARSPGTKSRELECAFLSHRTSQMSATVSEVELDCMKPSPAGI